MILVTIPTTDVNSEFCTVTRWRAADGQTVQQDDVVAEVETSKAVIDVVAPSAGVLLRSASEGSSIPMGSAIASLFPDEASLNDHLARQRDLPAAGPRVSAVGTAQAAIGRGPKATKDAERLAASMGVDLQELARPGLITRKDVEEHLKTHAPVAQRQLPLPRAAPVGAEPVVLIGSGRGAEQVLEILRAANMEAARIGGRQLAVVALVDDYAQRWGQDVEGIPVVGGAERIATLFADKVIASAIITISSSVPARVRFRELCKRLGVPLVNAIDPSCRIPKNFAIGSGNVICAFCHFGTGTVVGDNNFLSAYNSYDHHCVLGDDISTGPGVMASGTVQIGSRARLGTGIYIEPNLTIGENVQIASGAIIMQSVPSGHTVKVRAGQTAVTPINPE